MCQNCLIGGILLNKTKLILLFSILCLFIAVPASFAADNDTAIIEGDVPIADYYFDANIENDTGDGSILNPYKTLTSARIHDNSNIHLADGEYKLDRISYVNKVNILGSNPEKTIVSFNGKGFDLEGPFTLTNVTLVFLSVDAGGENLTATNTIFRNFYSSSSLAPVMGNGGNVDINNCTFKDNSADNGGAIYMNGGKLSITDSLFVNNNAKKYGGAISCENEAHAEIYNSRFESNTANEEAGGAIYLLESTLITKNVEINNCQAPFGGAITSLKSEINLTGFKSKNNRAKYYGGSVYSLYHTFIIANSVLVNNSAFWGGALFADCVESFHIHDNYFANNTADIGSAVYSRVSDFYYDSIYDKKLNNSFDNNNVFESDTLNITFVNDDYLMIKLNSTDTSVLPSYYNLRDLGLVTPVKDQGAGGNCWAFSSLAAIESAILKSTNTSYDLSEENMKNLMSLYSAYGWTMDTNKGGYAKMGVGYLAGWLGPVNESDDAYNSKSLISPLLTSIIHVQNILFLTRDNFTDNDAIKKAIMEYGALSTSIYWSSSYLKGKNYYYKGDSGANHAVAIIGWDDNYDKSNFKNTPEGNGAWIIKNSWGTKGGDNGFYYVSYYDKFIAQPGKYNTAAYVLNNSIKYDKIYQYDVQGYTDFFLNTTNTVWYKNKFTATADEYLAAVSTYSKDETTWDLSVYVNGALKSTKSGKSSPGYFTYDLDHLIALKKGDVFEVVFKTTVDGDVGVPISEYVSLNTETYTENISFISYDGKNWWDLYDLEWTYPDHTYASQVACIKAFTLSDKINTEVNLNVIYNRLKGVSTIVASVHDEWGNIVRDGNVVFTVDGNQYRITVIAGKASLNYNLDETSHVISAIFTGSDYHSSNKTIQFIKPDNVEAQFSIADIEFAHDLTAFILLQDDFGNIIADEVNLKINDLTYKLTVSDDKYYEVPFKLDDGTYEAELSGNGFESKKINFTVYKSLANLGIVINTNYDAVSIDLTLSERYNETAIVNIFGNNMTVSMLNGHANLKYSNLACKNYDVKVYLSDNYKDNFKADSFKIDYRNTTLSVSDLTTYYNSGGELRITLVDSDNKPVSNRDIEVTHNSQKSTVKTDDDGIAIYEAYFEENGIHYVGLEFIGDDYYVSSISAAKITVLSTIVLISDLTKTYGSYYTFQLLDTSGNPLKNHEISVEIGGINEFIESDSNGVFSLKIDQKVGNYKLVIVNPVNGEEISKTIKVVSRITENKDVTIYYGAGKSYTVKVFDDNGNPMNGASVKFSINGKTYTRTSNQNGYASFKLTLNPATYTITASYKGFSVSNKIVIKPTLIMSAKTVKKSKTFKYTVKLLNTNGKILKNKKITVKFRGKTYKANTNSKGIANFNIKALSKTGKFTLTASYGSAKISKKITVKK